MKRLLLPLLTLAVAFPAAAEIPHRCVVDWLGPASNFAKNNPGQKPVDDKNYLSGKPLFDLNAPPSPVCDPTVWNYLSGQWESLGDMRSIFAAGLGPQLQLLAFMDQTYQYVDSRGLNVLVKADAVVDAAVKLGLVQKIPGAGLVEIQKKGRTGAIYAREDDYSLKPLQESKPSLSADEVAANFKALCTEKGPCKSGSGIIAFRAAVIQLADEISTRTRSKFLARKLHLELARDLAGASNRAPLKNVRGMVEDDANDIPSDFTKDDANYYKDALDYLTQASDDELKCDKRSSANNNGLFFLDCGLARLVKSRAAAVDAALKAAQDRLNGSSVAELVEGMHRDAQKAKDAAAAAAAAIAAQKALEKRVETALAKALPGQLGQNATYAQLNKYFENQKAADPSWAGTADGKAVSAYIQGVKAAAASVRVADGKVHIGHTDLEIAVPPQLNEKDPKSVGDLTSRVVGEIEKYFPWSARLLGTPAALDPDRSFAVTQLHFSDRFFNYLGDDVVIGPQDHGKVFAGIIAQKYKDPAAAEASAGQRQKQLEDLAAWAAAQVEKMHSQPRLEKESASDYYFRTQQHEPFIFWNLGGGYPNKVAELKIDPDETLNLEWLDKNLQTTRSQAYWEHERLQKLVKTYPDNHSRAVDETIAHLAADLEYFDKHKPDKSTRTKMQWQEELDRKVDSAYSDSIVAAFRQLQTDCSTPGNARYESLAEATGDGVAMDLRLQRTADFFRDLQNPRADNSYYWARCKYGLGWRGDSEDRSDLKDPTADNVFEFCLRESLVKFIETGKTHGTILQSD